MWSCARYAGAAYRRRPEGPSPCRWLIGTKPGGRGGPTTCAIDLAEAWIPWSS
jgi:hypothetical protein